MNNQKVDLNIVIGILRFMSLVLYMLVLLFLALIFGFWQGLALTGILVLFGWAMNLEQSIRKIEKDRKDGKIS